MGLWRKEIKEETKKQLWLAVPMIFVCVFQFSLQLISLMFVGHLNELFLAAVSLSSSITNAFGFNVMMGLSSALDTFCGQAYGAKQYQMVGVHTQGAMVVLILVSIPVSIMWVFLEPILILLHQNKEVAALAQLYARYLIPSLSANALLRCITKFLQTQNIVFPMVLATGLTSMLHILLCWLFIQKLDYGIKGSAIAICISNWFNTIILALYIRFSPSCKQTWTGFSKQSLHNIPKFLRLALPSAVMVCLESWTFEIIVILSGALPNAKLQTSVLSICLNTSGIFWMIPFGVSAAGSTRISNELGADCPKAAYLAVKVTMFLTFLVGLVEFSVLMSLWKVWGRAFTNVHAVLTYLISMMPIVASSTIVDSIQTGFQGVARGCGWQKIGALINLGCNYLLGVPFSVVSAFVFHMKGQGLFLGIVLALTAQVVCFLLVTLRANWEKEAKRAIARVGGNGVQVEEH
ncbi:protein DETOXIFICATION 16-like [Vigna unguiculata]|uniref:protein DETOXIFICATION 16-like n=1 Tax=Vigna unguiculata TaxID=3917 RepID=UPI0010164806|nr:protein DETOXIFICATION 16-like [Vigna unguiculata]